MLAFLGPIVSKIGLKVLVALALVGAVIAVFFGGKNAGKAAEKVEQFERNSEVRRKQDAVQAPDPSDIDDILDRL